MCACGFRREWQVATPSDSFYEETDVEITREMYEVMKRTAETAKPLLCPKCHLKSAYLYFPEHRN
jgi:hypothetical protein